MAKKLSGIDVSVNIGGYMVQFEEVTLTIDDKSKATMSGGRPNGYVQGAVSASGSITLDTDNLLVLLDVAKNAGSWQQMEAFDLGFSAETKGTALNIEAFECLIKLADLLKANPGDEEKLTHTLPYEVTGKDFIRINGVPYADTSDIERLR